MTRKLELSPDLSLPIDAATQTFAFIGRKGSGKTYAAGKLFELLFGAGVQTVVLDTVGNWYGLRLSADGKKPGLDVPIFGGLRGDLALNPQAGELVADTLAETGRSGVIDVSQFVDAERKRFATAFGERMWQRKKAETHPSPVHLMIEECQLLIPQFVRGDDARMVGVYERIVRLGRNYGVGCSMITQRPQSVNKEALTQTEMLVAFQVNGVPERKALREWVTHQGLDVNLVDELPGLPVGTAYAWSPQWLGILKKIKIGPKETFDASSTPRVGEHRERRSPAPLDLKDLGERMSALVEETKANDPRELKRKVAELEGKLAAAAKVKPTVETKTVQKPVITDAQIAKIEKLTERAASVMANLGKALTWVSEAVRPARVPTTIAAAKPAPVYARATRPSTPRPAPIRPAGASADNQVGGGLRRMLIALAQRPGLTNRQIGLRAGLSSQSGTFSTYLGRARANGWITDDGERRYITEAGLAVLGKYEPLPSGQALLEYWTGQLGGGAARMLRALAQVYPHGLSNEQLGDLAQISHQSGTFSTYLGRLRGLELVTGGRGDLRASEELFD